MPKRHYLIRGRRKLKRQNIGVIRHSNNKKSLLKRFYIILKSFLLFLVKKLMNYVLNHFVFRELFDWLAILVDKWF